MQREQFEFALTTLSSAHWQWFEELAAEFLVSEFPEIRTTACVHGDRGRDAYLMEPETDDSLLFQYSVARDWKQKIRATAVVLNENFPNAKDLVYLTNQRIGADGDELRATLRTQYRLRLDIRDISWFLDRRNETPAREAAALELFDKVARPVLESKNFYEGKAVALDSIEQKTVLIHLEMQFADEAGDRNLTKVSFEALVRTALLETDSDHRMTRQEIHERVLAMVPDAERETSVARIDAALSRMDKVYVRHWRQQDEFNLTYEERQRLTERLAETAVESSRIDAELEAAAEWALSCEEDTVGLPSAERLVPVMRRVVEQLLLHRGEAIAQAPLSGGVLSLPHEDVTRAAAEAAVSVGLRDRRLPPILDRAIRAAAGPGQEAVVTYMRRLADAYTLLAFLKATPDVQRAIRTVYADGDLLLDTTIVLRLLAEELLEKGLARFTVTLATAREAGLRLHVSPDVVEETLLHIEKCRQCLRTPVADWRSDVPFLLTRWVSDGRNRDDFMGWVGHFRGQDNPEQDFAEYLSEVYGIQLIDLEDAISHVGEDVRIAVGEAWVQTHESRRFADNGISHAEELARRDANSYLGILGHREAVTRHAFLGYTSWWLTTDSRAFQLHTRLDPEIRAAMGRPPVMSPDFLTTFLAISPVRSRAQALETLPVLLDITRLDATPPALLERADEIRREMSGMPERQIRWRVRDELDRARCRIVPHIDEADAETDEA